MAVRAPAACECDNHDLVRVERVDLQSIDLERLLRYAEIVGKRKLRRAWSSACARICVTPSRASPSEALASRRLGQLAGTGAVADREAARLGTELARLRDTYAGRTSLTVLYQVWSHPIYTIGGSQGSITELAICGSEDRRLA